MNGSLMPVDDLLATLRTGLWHYHWSLQPAETADPRTALVLAFRQLRDGTWRLETGFVRQLERALTQELIPIARQLLADKAWLEERLAQAPCPEEGARLSERRAALYIQGIHLTMPPRRREGPFWEELEKLVKGETPGLLEERVSQWAIQAQRLLLGHMATELACMTEYWVQ